MTRKEAWERQKAKYLVKLKEANTSLRKKYYLRKYIAMFERLKNATPEDLEKPVRVYGQQRKRKRSD